MNRHLKNYLISNFATVSQQSRKAEAYILAIDDLFVLSFIMWRRAWNIFDLIRFFPVPIFSTYLSSVYNGLNYIQWLLDESQSITPILEKIADFDSIIRDGSDVHLLFPCLHQMHCLLNFRKNLQPAVTRECTYSMQSKVWDWEFYLVISAYRRW